MPPPWLLAVPNVSEGADPATIAALTAAIEAPGGGVRLLDTHVDADHGRSVFTFAGAPGDLAAATVRLAKAAVERIDLAKRNGAGHLAKRNGAGQHPHVGVLDVAPIVYLDEAMRGTACATALTLADRLGEELGLPVFLYGVLTAGEGEEPRTRAELRRGGVEGLAKRMAAPPEDPEALRPDFGPRELDPARGATLVAARPPLVAFNVELAPPCTVEDARRIAALIRETGDHGLPGLRAIGVELRGGVGQVSMNVERPFELPLAEVVRAIANHAPIARAELVGLAPAAAFEDFPPELPLPGFDPGRHLIENALGW
jgi:glutamate formiminotransferase